jgi:Type VI secretion system (T6SS), amidase immunity protein
MRNLTLETILAFACLGASAALAEVSPARTASDAVLLRNFAIAQCVRLAYDDPVVQADAGDAVGAYVEFGSVGPEAYEAALALAKTFLARSYPSKSGGKLQLMKCLDLMNSPELAALVKRHTQRKK